MSNDHAFFALMARMKYIDRWALMRNTSQENIMEHSHMVAVLAHALAVLENRYFGGTNDAGAVAVAALYHDATEVITGDMPTPIKYYSRALRRSYQQVEEMAQQRLLGMLPEELRDEYAQILSPADEHLRALVKAADKLSAYLKCVEELKAGNREFALAREQTWQALQSNPLPVLGYFIQRYLPGFELTLDELEGGSQE